jgi:hypothetical protein
MSATWQVAHGFVSADAEGHVSLGFADAELHDIEAQAPLSREVRACAIETPAEAAA